MSSETATLVPPRRLGNLLRDARLDAGAELEDVAARAQGLSVVDLDDIEHGRRMVDDPTIEQLSALYGVSRDTLIPARARLVIDLDQGHIAIEDSEEPTGGATDTDAVLTRYLALVYRLRDVPVGTPIGIRDVDVSVLSRALEIESEDVERRLQQLISEPEDVIADQRRLRSRLIVPVAGVVIAACAAGLLVLLAEPASSPDPVDGGFSTVTDIADPTRGVGSTGGPETRIGTGGAVVIAPSAPTDIGTPAVETNGG